MGRSFDGGIMPKTFLVSIAVLVVAAWVLATFTIGEAVGGRQSELVGFAVALLIGLSAYHLPAVRVPESVAGRLAAGLVAGGLVLLLSGLALQFYLAYLSSEHARRAADVIEQAARSGQRVSDVNIRANSPPSVGAIGYACVLAGVGAMVCGVRVAVPTGRPVATGGEPSAADRPA